MSDTEQDLTFVKVLSRVIGKKLDQQGLENPAIPISPSSKTLAKDTLQALSCQTGVLPVYVGFDRVLSQ